MYPVAQELAPPQASDAQEKVVRILGLLREILGPSREFVGLLREILGPLREIAG
ncbi:hypothetical protein [Lentibacillus salinarum]|uniref:Uncharacterized protein n=1 Tax=Lentibacillus salinarum TaxID=446820 RepID=A0ABW3ZUU9_9BACI